MPISLTKIGEVPVIHVSGWIDSSNAPEMATEIRAIVDIELTDHVLIVELSECEYMSSAGLREIVALYKRLAREKRELRLAAPSRRVLDILEMSGLHTVFTLYDSITAAAGAPTR
jgi:anti-anti-sigma factor